MGWMNDVITDIGTRHDWDFFRVKGQKVLVAGNEEQSLIIGPPGAPSVATSSGGSLTDNSVYKVLITFVESSGVESAAGTASSSVTPSGSDLQIDVTSIPTSTEPLVTKRKVYLQKDGGAFLLSTTIDDNTTTSTTISADSSSLVEPPDYNPIRVIDGELFLESSSQLEFRDVDQLRLLFQGSFSSGTPSFWSSLGGDRVLLYPKPSSAIILSFYYYRVPKRIYASTDSVPDLPIWLKPVIRAGVISRGYEYRDRDGQESKLSNYEQLLSDAFSRHGDSKRVKLRVRDVVGDADGWET